MVGWRAEVSSVSGIAFGLFMLIRVVSRIFAIILGGCEDSLDGRSKRMHGGGGGQKNLMCWATDS